jgi:hypothetical protein
VSSADDPKSNGAFFGFALVLLLWGLISVGVVVGLILALIAKALR